jgi:5'-nucleotidase
VVGGHSHTFLFTGNTLPSTEKLYGKYPLVFDHGVKGKTLVVQAYANGKYIGKLDTEFDENGIIVKFGGNPILLDSNTAEGSKKIVFLLIKQL